jgi:hypothetical protein
MSYAASVPPSNSTVVALIAVALTTAHGWSPTPGDVRTTEIDHNVYMLSAPTANALVVIDDAGSLYAGVQAPELLAAARTLATSFDRPFKYAVMMEDEVAPEVGDGGWGERGALTVAHESLYARMRQFQHKGPAPALPMVSFSEIIQLWLKDEQIHLIHHQSGYSNSDTFVHVEKSGVLFTGSLFTTDGYPALLLDRGGSISQLIEFSEYMAAYFGDEPGRIEPIVPGRGPVATMRDLREYSDMLAAIYERIRDMVSHSYPLKSILALQPTSEFDPRWGHGPVTPTDFTVQVYNSIKKDQQKGP